MRYRSWFRCLGLSVSLTAIAAATAAAQEAPPPSFGGDFWTRPKLTGDWGGLRDQWALKGFTVDLNTVYVMQGVASGGLPGSGTDFGNTVNDNLVFGLDTAKAGLWTGGFFKLRIENRAGTSVSSKAGTVSPVNSAALFPSSSGNTDKSVFGVTELTFTQFFSQHFAAFGGLLNVLEADSNPIAGNLRRNATFFNSAFLASAVEIAEGPSVALGAGALYMAPPEVTGEVFVVGSQETATRNPFDNWNGTTIGTEWTIHHQLGGHPGGQVIGFLDSIDKRRTDIFQDTRLFLGNVIQSGGLVPTTRNNSWALYYNAHQFIQGDEKKGWGPFLRAGVSDGNPNPVRWNIAAGLGGNGLIPGRDADAWGLGYYHLQLSNEGLLTTLHLSDENGGEIFYNFAVTPALHATLDSQWVSSARPRQETAWILGARLNLDF